MAPKQALPRTYWQVVPAAAGDVESMGQCMVVDGETSRTEHKNALSATLAKGDDNLGFF